MVQSLGIRFLLNEFPGVDNVLTAGIRIRPVEPTLGFKFPALSLISCVTLAKSLYLSVSVSSPVNYGHIDTHLMELLGYPVTSEKQFI